MKQLSLAELNAMKDKIFYVNIKGAIVACRFKSLIVYYSGHYRMDYKTKKIIYTTDRFNYMIECANSDNIFGNYSWLPKIYETIDDCVNDKNSLYKAVVDENELLEQWRSSLKIVKDIFGEHIAAMTWRRNKKTFEIEEVGIGQGRYDVIKGELLSCFERPIFKTREECVANSPIQVVTF